MFLWFCCSIQTNAQTFAGKRYVIELRLEGLLHLAWPSEDLAMLPKHLGFNSAVLNGEAAKRAQARGDIHELDLLEPDLRRWNQLTEEEKEEDPFADSLLGPFQNAQGEVYYYHLESMQFVWKPEEQGVLSLTQVCRPAIKPILFKKP
eukprot:g32914.t1